MKILLLNPDGTPKIVYHQDYRIIDHNKDHIIDVIQDKNYNDILSSYTYTGADLEWENCDNTNEREVKVTYKGVVPVDDWARHPSGVLTGGETEAPEYVD